MLSRNIQFYRAQEESQTTTGNPMRETVLIRNTHKKKPLRAVCGEYRKAERTEMSDESNLHQGR